MQKIVDTSLLSFEPANANANANAVNKYLLHLMGKSESWSRQMGAVRTYHSHDCIMNELITMRVSHYKHTTSNPGQYYCMGDITHALNHTLT